MIDIIISMSDAAAMIQPFLSDINAFNILVDWRRKEPRYRSRILKPPRFLKGSGRSGAVKYPKSEIDRVIKEMLAIRMLKASL